MFQKEFDNTGNIKEFALWAADFLDNLPVGMYRTTLEGELVFCNWAFAYLLGYHAATNLQDFKVVDLFPHKSERGIFIRQVLEQGSVQHYTMQMIKKNGEHLTCSTTARAVMNDDGQVTFIDGVMSESNAPVSETSALTYPSEADATNHVSLRVDSQGNIEELNESAARFLGQKPGTTSRPLSLYSFTTAESGHKLTQLLQSARNQGLALDILPLTGHDGVTRQMECQATTISGYDEHLRIDFLCRDISHTINTMRQSQIEERRQGVVEMAGGIAHNMNQPLTIVNNLLVDLASDLVNEDNEIHDKLSRIQYQLDKLNAIAKKIRSVKQYKSIHYLLGEKIVDLDQLS